MPLRLQIVGQTGIRRRFYMNNGVPRTASAQPNLWHTRPYRQGAPALFKKRGRGRNADYSGKSFFVNRTMPTA